LHPDRKIRNLRRVNWRVVNEKRVIRFFGQNFLGQGAERPDTFALGSETFQSTHVGGPRSTSRTRKSDINHAFLVLPATVAVIVPTTLAQAASGWRDLGKD
jgi:hypothetical protein